MTAFRYRLASFLEDIAWSLRENGNDRANRKFISKYGLTDLPQQPRRVTKYNYYGAVNIVMLDELLQSGHISVDDHILDVGCGTGIFLFYLASKGFTYLTGQDLDYSLCSYAWKNKNAFLAVEPDYKGHIEIRNENAITAGVPSDINVCYLFNSFYDQNTYTEWLEVLHESIRQAPRHVKVLLLYPTPASMGAFRECGWLKETGQIFSITQNCHDCVRFEIFEN